MYLYGNVIITADVIRLLLLITDIEGGSMLYPVLVYYFNYKNYNII